MLEFVDLPGIPVDSVSEMLNTSNVSMIFKTNEGYLYKDFVCSNKKPYIKENKTMSVDGSLFVKLEDSYGENDVFILQNESKSSLSHYKNYQLTDKIIFDKNTLVESLNTNILFAAYNGSTLNYIGIKNDKFIENYQPTDYKAPFSWEIPTDDFGKCFLSTDLDLIMVYNGKSIYRIDLFFGTKMNKIVELPSGVKSIAKGNLFHLFGCQDGVYLLDYLKQEPIKILDDSLTPLGDTQNLGIFEGDISVAGERVGEKYKLVGIKRGMLQGDKSSTKPFPPTIIGFDELPKATFAVGFAEIDYGLKVYAFTSEGLFKSDEIYHDDFMEDLIKNVDKKKSK